MSHVQLQCCAFDSISIEKFTQFLYVKYKLKMFGCVHNVLYKMPKETHECNGCPYPLRCMVVVYSGIRETIALLE